MGININNLKNKLNIYNKMFYSLRKKHFISGVYDVTSDIEQEFINVEKLLLKSLSNNQLLVSELLTIQIETSNRCNLFCNRCPLGRKLVERDTKDMSDKMFKKILQLLGTLNDYRHLIILNGYNEPLLDENIFKRAKDIRTVQPNSVIMLNTNGTLIEDKIKKIKNSAFDYMIISTYDEITRDIVNNTLNKYNNSIYITNLELDSDMAIIVNKKHNKNDILNNKKVEIRHIYKSKDACKESDNRCGIFNDNKLVFNRICLVPWYNLTINVDGNIKICNHDASNNTVIGNIFDYNSIDSILNNEKLILYRNELIKSKSLLEPCKYCNNETLKFIIRCIDDIQDFN